MKIYKDAKLSKLIKLDFKLSWYLWGDVGVGKTHNAFGLLYKWNLKLEKQRTVDEEKGIYVGYPYMRLVNWAILTDDFRNTPLDVDVFAGQNRTEKERSLIHNRYLVIDDIGAEKRSDYTDDLLMRLTEYRYSNGLYTGFTSNLSIGKLPYDARIVSRIVGITGNNKFKITGKDRRL